MGAKVDPVVSFGCYGAPSQTRLDLNPFSFSFFFWGGDATSLPLCGTVKSFAAAGGEITGAGVKEITELPLWPMNCVSRRPTLEFLRAEDTFQSIVS